MPQRVPSHPSHQTVRLGKGKHASSREGVCVMELASMLADEPFTDQPRSVCRVIAALLRAYNDGADDQQRQQLYGVATRVVGTRDSREVERRRAERCAALMVELHTGQPRLRRWLRPSPPICLHDEALEATGVQLARMLLRHRDGTPERVLAIVDELVAIGQGDVTGDPAAWRPAPEAAPRQATAG